MNKDLARRWKEDTRQHFRRAVQGLPGWTAL